MKINQITVFGLLSISILSSLSWNIETRAGEMHDIDCKQVLKNLEMHVHSAISGNELSMERKEDGKTLEARMFFEMSHGSIAIAADWAAVYSAMCK